MAGSRNDTHYSKGYDLQPVDAGAIRVLQALSDTTQEINVSGSPEGVWAANPGSVAHDRTNGNFWLKKTGTGNTGWEQIQSGGSVAISFVTDSGTATPSAGILNQLGSGSITTTGSGNNLTTTLTGLTNHAVLVGAGTSTITKIAATSNTGAVLQNNSGADPSYSTATYPSTTTVNQLLYSSAANTVTGLATANSAVLTTSAAGVPQATALSTDGQLIIGSTAGAPAAATLTQGSGISITNAANSITIAVSGSSVGQTITGDSGGALSPTAGNWNILGSGSITTSGSVSSLTTQLTGLTNHAVLVGAGTSTITKVGPSATAGQVFQSAGAAADPAFSTATYPSTATGTGTILRADGTNWSATTATYPNTTTANQLLYSSATNTIDGLTSANNGTLVTSNTGVPSILAGPGTTGNILQSNAAAAPSFSTATYPSTTTINQILYSSAANTVTGLATANNAVLTTGATGVPQATSLAADGQLLIGSGSGAPIAATLTAGSGVSIANGSNSITISSTSGGFTWTDVTSATQTLAAQNGYITDRGGGVTYTLPASGALGDTIKIVGKLGLATITPNANQQILIGSASGTVGVTGTAVSNNAGDCVELICITAGASTVWRADSVIGTWTLN